MSTLVYLLAALLFLLGAAFYSGCEMGLYSLNRLRLRLRLAREGDRRAGLLLDLAQQREKAVLAILLSQNVMNYLLTAAASVVIMRATGAADRRAELYTAAILSPLTFVFGDVVPKNWFQVQANRLMYPAATLLAFSVGLFRRTGLIWLLDGMNRLVARLTGHEDLPEWRGARGEIVGLLREGAAEGTLTEEQTRMIERVMNLSTLRAGEVMIPRARVVTIPHDADRRAFERLVREHDYSRLPVIGPDRRSVTGIVNIYDVLSDESAGGLTRWVRPPLLIDASTTTAAALLQLRSASEPLGVVIDRRRGFVGILTPKDIVEEIFGELTAW